MGVHRRQLISATGRGPDVNKPATFTDAGGQPVLLTPGRTWVELAEAGTTNVTYA